MEVPQAWSDWGSVGVFVIPVLFAARGSFCYMMSYSSETLPPMKPRHMRTLTRLLKAFGAHMQLANKL